MSRRVILLTFLLLSRFGLSAPVFVNAVAGKVGEQLITVQEAYFFRGIQRLRTGERPTILLETDKNLKSTVQKLMFEHMIAEEAKISEFKDPDPKQTSEQVKKITDQAQSGEWKRLLNTFSVTEAEGLKRITRGILAEKFLKKKIESLTPIVTDAEIEEYIRNYPEKVKRLGDKKQSLIAEALKKDRIDKGLQDYIDFLSEKYSATFLLS
ncbi:MAG: hypothetical protein ACKN9V_03525 [Pseudomonadota bacterium]